MENELLKNDDEINNIFDNIKELVINSRNKVYSVVNTEMLNLYWNIGKAIMEIQQGDERASYGDAVLEKLSQKLTYGCLWFRPRRRKAPSRTPSAPCGTAGSRPSRPGRGYRCRHHRYKFQYASCVVLRILVYNTTIIASRAS